VTLAAEIPQAQVTGWDISASALAVARENARRHNVSATFEQVDVLSPHPSSLISHFSLIVSNPPYICNKERARMERNVLDHEPHEALFVPDDDPLLFYRAIARYAANALKPGGWLYFEINPLYADDLQALLSAMRFYLIETHSDQYGKQRMLRAQR
jgi:release factor glutamine methyltransferase